MHVDNMSLSHGACVAYRMEIRKYYSCFQESPTIKHNYRPISQFCVLSNSIKVLERCVFNLNTAYPSSTIFNTAFMRGSGENCVTLVKLSKRRYCQHGCHLKIGITNTDGILHHSARARKQRRGLGSRNAKRRKLC
jgi:hypothetical protein